MAYQYRYQPGRQDPGRARGQARYRPRWALTPDLAERLRAHKAELLAALREVAATGRPTPTQCVLPASVYESF